MLNTRQKICAAVNLCAEELLIFSRKYIKLAVDWTEKSGNGGKTLEISDNYGTADKKSADKASGKPQNSAEILELCESEKALFDFIEEAYEGANFSTAELELDYEYTSQDEIAALLKKLRTAGRLKCTRFADVVWYRVTRGR